MALLQAEKNTLSSDLEAKDLEISSEKSLKEKAKPTIDKWRPQYNMPCAKLKKIFEGFSKHLEEFVHSGTSFIHIGLSMS